MPIAALRVSSSRPACVLTFQLLPRARSGGGKPRGQTLLLLPSSFQADAGFRALSPRKRPDSAPGPSSPSPEVIPGRGRWGAMSKACRGGGADTRDYAERCPPAEAPRELSRPLATPLAPTCVFCIVSPASRSLQRAVQIAQALSPPLPPRSRGTGGRAVYLGGVSPLSNCEVKRILPLPHLTLAATS